MVTGCAQFKPVAPSFTSNLKTDEDVILLPTNAHFDATQQAWVASIHGWVFEPEPESMWRHAVVNSLRSFIDVTDAQRPLFEQRVRMFLVDNERKKQIIIGINGKAYQAPDSSANGHFEFTVTLPVGKSACQNHVTANVLMNSDDKRVFTGDIQCPDETGISVISDIDDTIKQSNVLDKKELMKNTFVRPFTAVPSMPDLYRHWAKQGYAFHYVSSSPWQLYPFLNQFLIDSGYPSGSMHLKQVRLKDSSFMNLFATPEEGKIPTITALLERYPKRKFILVGDSGEKDPEIYATIAKQYPDRIIKILIHDVAAARDRLSATIFAELSADQWMIFTDADQLPKHNVVTIKPDR